MHYNMMKGSEAHQATRNGWQVMWVCCPDLFGKWGLPEPGEYVQDNFHQGVMWGSMNEYRKHPLSELRCVEIFLRCFKAGISLDQLKQVRKTCSYIYHCETGIAKSNYPCFKNILKCIDTRKCRASKQTVKPHTILDEKDMVRALTTEWHPACGMTFVEFLRGYLILWDGWVLGARPNKDIGKIRDSEEHHFEDNCWSSAYLGGRSKLELQQDGTRPWRAWRICMCPNEKHIAPTGTFPFCLDRWGNPTESWSQYCTTCPVFIGEFLEQSMPPPFRPYRKWLDSKSRSNHGRSRWGKDNMGKLHDLAMRFLDAQGVRRCSKNSGRKTTARLSHVVKSPHCELLHITGDLPDTWRKCYQPSYPPTNYKVREQSLNPAVATGFLVRIRKLCARAAPPQPAPSGLNRVESMMWMIASRLGIEDDVRTVL